MTALLRAAVVAALSAGPAFAASPPKRAPGLWETTTITDAGRTVAKECVDARTDRLTRQIMAGVTCRNDDFKVTAEGYSAGAICSSGGMSIDNKVTLSGDFESFARAENVTVMTGLPGEGGGRRFYTAIEARRLGDCAPDQRPGDVILPNGTVVNVPPAGN
ncbi:DUF3617 domain-containing protein [Methylopila musalis]|uniref:DUF3617 domain-containing protein n=1 Tax=Methylopila musalis TaxID=1134781 RepID=A0ABW3Z781_9HYPH